MDEEEDAYQQQQQEREEQEAADRKALLEEPERAANAIGEIWMGVTQIVHGYLAVIRPLPEEEENEAEDDDNVEFAKGENRGNMDGIEANDIDDLEIHEVHERVELDGTQEDTQEDPQENGQDMMPNLPLVEHEQVENLELQEGYAVAQAGHQDLAPVGEERRADPGSSDDPIVIDSDSDDEPDLQEEGIEVLGKPMEGEEDEAEGDENDGGDMGPAPEPEPEVEHDGLNNGPVIHDEAAANGADEEQGDDPFHIFIPHERGSAYRNPLGAVTIFMTNFRELMYPIPGYRSAYHPLQYILQVLLTGVTQFRFDLDDPKIIAHEPRDHGGYDANHRVYVYDEEDRKINKMFLWQLQEGMLVFGQGEEDAPRLVRVERVGRPTVALQIAQQRSRWDTDTRKVHYTSSTSQTVKRVVEPNPVLRRAICEVSWVGSCSGINCYGCQSPALHNTHFRSLDRAEEFFQALKERAAHEHFAPIVGHEYFLRGDSVYESVFETVYNCSGLIPAALLSMNRASARDRWIIENLMNTRDLNGEPLGVADAVQDRERLRRQLCERDLDIIFGPWPNVDPAWSREDIIERIRSNFGSAQRMANRAGKDALKYFDPYIVGLFLGDGVVGPASITTSDASIQMYIECYQEALLQEYNIQMRVAHHLQQEDGGLIDMEGRTVLTRHPCFIISLWLTRENRATENPMRAMLNAAGIYNQKDVAYLRQLLEDQSVHIKLQVCAGMIDTDGSKSKYNGGYIFSQMQPQHAPIVTLLADLCQETGIAFRHLRPMPRATGPVYPVFLCGANIELLAPYIRNERKRNDFGLEERFKDLPYHQDFKRPDGVVVKDIGVVIPFRTECGDAHFVENEEIEIELYPDTLHSDDGTLLTTSNFCFCYTSHAYAGATPDQWQDDGLFEPFGAQAENQFARHMAYELSVMLRALGIVSLTDLAEIGDMIRNGNNDHAREVFQNLQELNNRLNRLSRAFDVNQRFYY